MSRQAALPCSALLFAFACLGQQTITTAAGGGPNHLAATASNLNNPAGVATDGSGNYYIAAPAQSRVFKVDASGQLSVFAGNGTPGSAVNGATATDSAMWCPTGVAAASSGDIYIADQCNSVVYKVSGGVITTFAGIDGSFNFDGDGIATAHSLCGPVGVAVDAAGNVYIADQCNNLVREVSGGLMITIAGAGLITLSDPAGVAVDNAGNVYIADQGNNLVRKLTGGVLSTFLGDGDIALSGPAGIAVDSAGNVYIADAGNNVIREVSGHTITTIAGNGNFDYTGDGGPATSASMAGPTGVAVDGSGKVYIADEGNNVIRVVSGGIINTAAGNTTPGFSGDGGSTFNASLFFPLGAAVDGSGNLFISDSGNQRIRKVTPDGTITTVAGNGGNGYDAGATNAVNTSLNNPFGIAVDSAGNLYIADESNNVVRKVTPAGLISTIAGGGASCPDAVDTLGDGCLATSAKLSRPEAVAFDPSGNLYIADRGNRRIRKVTAGIISTVAGNGSLSSTGDGGPATAAGIGNPYGVAIDKDGNLLIADNYNCVVRRVSGGNISTVAGNGSSSATGDGGPATAAGIGCPTAVAADSAGNFFIPDSLNNVVRMVDSSGTISTIAGDAANNTQGFTGDGGPATAATLACPISLALDPQVNIFIVDECNQRIRRVSAAANPAGSVTVTSSASPSVYGQPVTLTATVSPASATGTVEFFDGASSLGSAAVAAGSASIITSALMAGSHSITAQYSGDNQFAGGVSPAFLQTVTPANTTTTASNASVTYGDTGVTLAAAVTATAPSGAVVNEGTVTFTVAQNGNPVGAPVSGPVSNGSATAAFSLGAAGAGSYSIAAVYHPSAMNPNFTTSNDLSKTLTVNPASTLISLNAPAIAYGATGVATVTVTAGAIPAAGSVTLSVDGSALPSQVLTAGSATFNIPGLSAGDHTLSASYPAQGNFLGSSAAGTLHVDKIASLMILTSSANPSVFGQLVTLTASVSGAAGVPTGNVQFLDGVSPLGASALQAGAATLVISNLSAGPHSITAHYAGDGNFNDSTSDALAQSVSRAGVSIGLVASLAQSVVGQPVTFTATVSTGVLPSAGVPSGTVQFLVDGSNLGPPAPLTNGSAALTTSGLALGPHTITAVYSGDVNFTGATSGGVAESVVQAATSTSVTTSASPSVFGTSVTFTAAVNVLAPGVGPAGGAVQFIINGVNFGPPAALNNGAAAITAALAAGTYTVDAIYNGSTNFLPSSGELTQIVSPMPTAASVSVAPAARQYSDLVSFTATLSPAMANNVAPAQTVTFLIGTQTLGTVSLVANGGILTATLSNVPLLEPAPYKTPPTGQMAPGSHVVTAVFGGVNANFTVTNPTTSLTIAPEDARVTYTGALAASTTTSSSNTAIVTLSATVRDISATAEAAGDASPGDIRNASVTFINRDSGTPIATVPIGLVNMGDGTTGVATYNWAVNTASASSASYRIGVIVGGYYQRDDPSDNVTVTITRASNGWVSGSGSLLLQNPAGQAAGAPNTLANFNFNEKFAGAGKAIQGNFTLTLQNAGHTYQIADQPLASLAVQANGNGATFDGLVTVQDVTNPANPVALDPSANLQVNMTGNTVGITVWNQAGGLWFSSNWDGTGTVQQAPASGSLKIH